MYPYIKWDFYWSTEAVLADADIPCKTSYIYVNCTTYDCNRRTETTIRQEQFAQLQFGKRFVWIRIKRCPFNPSPWTNDCIPAEQAVQDAAMFLYTQQNRKLVKMMSITGPNLAFFCHQNRKQAAAIKKNTDNYLQANEFLT